MVSLRSRIVLDSAFVICTMPSARPSIIAVCVRPMILRYSTRSGISLYSMTSSMSAAQVASSIPSGRPEASCPVSVWLSPYSGWLTVVVAANAGDPKP